MTERRLLRIPKLPSFFLPRKGGAGRGRESIRTEVPELHNVKLEDDPVNTAVEFYVGDNTPLDRVREQLTRQFNDRDQVEINSMVRTVQERRGEKANRATS